MLVALRQSYHGTNNPNALSCGSSKSIVFLCARPSTHNVKAAAAKRLLDATMRSYSPTTKSSSAHKTICALMWHEARFQLLSKQRNDQFVVGSATNSHGQPTWPGVVDLHKHACHQMAETKASRRSASWQTATRLKHIPTTLRCCRSSSCGSPQCQPRVAPTQLVRK